LTQSGPQAHLQLPVLISSDRQGAAARKDNVMTIPAAWLDTLKARITLSTVIAQTHRLTKVGGEHKALCPFHDDKAPSLTVSDDKGFFHCFPCGAHGDAFDWLERTRGLSFTEAAQALADTFGLALAEQSAEASAQAQTRSAVLASLTAAAAWFSQTLQSKAGTGASDYLAKRGITAKSIADFGLGYAPASSSALRRALGRFGDDILIAAGLLISVDGKAPYDRFRGRLMFPIRDARGQVIGFGGRLLGPGEPKYLNSPETIVFDKGKTLYNLDRAAAAARRTGRLIAVEGYLDVIALDQAGFDDGVAPLGTALTDDHLARLWRHSQTNPLICFDGDGAGQRAALRTVVRALPHLAPDRSLDFVSLPAGVDPDDFIRTEGAAKFAALLDAAVPMATCLWHHELAAKPLTTPEARAGLRQRLRDQVALINDPAVRAEYRSEFERRLAIAASGIDAAFLRAVFAGMLRHPSLIGACEEALSQLVIDDAQLAKLRDVLLRVGSDSESVLDDSAHEAGLSPLVEALRRSDGLSFSFTQEGSDPSLAKRDLRITVEALAAKPALDQALAAATQALSADFNEDSFAEQQRLVAMRIRIDGQLAAILRPDEQ
jgi:DNA primase